MLTHRERRRIRQIEQQLAAEDPGFVSRMRVPAPPRFPVAAAACGVMAISLPIVMLLGGWLWVVGTMWVMLIIGGMAAARRFR